MATIEEKKDVSSMIYLPGGRFLMGAEDGAGFPRDGEGPLRLIELHHFYIDPYAVTNDDFAKFVAATGYTRMRSVSDGRLSLKDWCQSGPQKP